ncbi:MAG: hypothetical protein K0S07_1463 [Chlamydiales bacterium]|nr:hypothetical protein [Chlamydiales bacterium]
MQDEKKEENRLTRAIQALLKRRLSLSFLIAALWLSLYSPLAIFLFLIPLLFFFKRTFSIGCVLSLLLALFSLAHPDERIPFLKVVNLELMDLFFLNRGPIAPSKSVVIVDIDEKSLKRAQWPWPRSDVAKMIEYVLQDGAKVVGLDMVFAEEDRLSLKDWAKRLQDLGLAISLPGLGSIESRSQIAAGSWSLPRENLSFAPSKELAFLSEKEGSLIIDNDQYLAEALAHPKVVSAAFFLTEGNHFLKERTYVVERGDDFFRSMHSGSAIIDQHAVFPKIRRSIGQILNSETIQKSCHHQGMTNVVPDLSGTARSCPLIMQVPLKQRGLALKNGSGAVLSKENYEEQEVECFPIYPSLSLEMYRLAEGYDRAVPSYCSGQRRALTLKSLERRLHIPLDEHGDLYLNFLGYGGPWREELAYGPEYYFTYLSAADVLEGSLPAGTFQGKCVLIGSTDPTLADLIGTPYRSTFPGLEVHAVALDNLIQKSWLIPEGKRDQLYRFSFLLFGGLALSFIFSIAPLWLSLISAACAMAAVPLFGYLSLIYYREIFFLSYLWLSLALICLLLLIFNYFLEGREKRFVVHLFSEMVSKEVLEQLSKDPDGSSLNGQKAEVSVMFSDIEGFTCMAEKLAPKEVIALLNEYLKPVTETILKSGGFIDKFMGDGVMACWGVPYPDPDHAQKACLTCLQQQEMLKELKPYFLSKYQVELSVRMGISSGDVFAGLMGAKSRKSFTVLGDTVNLGARLESACRYFGVKILLSESTYLLAQDFIEVRYISNVVVKGKSTPVPVYELLGLKGSTPPALLQLKAKYENALMLYSKRLFKEAESELLSLTALYPEDVAAQKLLLKVLHCLAAEPPLDWSPFIVLSDK